MGIDQRKGQYMIHDGGQVKYARTVVRMPEVNKFDRDKLAKIAATPWDFHVPRGTEVVFKENKRRSLMTTSTTILSCPDGST